MRGAGIDAEIPADINLATWEKFAFLVPMAACTASMRSTIGPIRANGRAFGFLLDVMREVVAVGQALGVALPRDFVERRKTFIEALPPEMTASMAGDLARGNRLELPWLSGAVVDLGRKPVCRLRSIGPSLKSWRSMKMAPRDAG